MAATRRCPAEGTATSARLKPRPSTTLGTTLRVSKGRAPHDSSHEGARPALARRSAAHRRHAGTDRGGVRARRVLRLFAVPGIAHAARNPLRVPAQPEPCRGPARCLFESAMGHRAVLRVCHLAGGEDHRPQTSTGFQRTNSYALRDVAVSGGFLAPGHHNFETAARAVRCRLDDRRARPYRDRVPRPASLPAKSPTYS